eukprot:scaffold239144_cov31-Tisochrysis_lutea.AAC.3
MAARLLALGALLGGACALHAPALAPLAPRCALGFHRSRRAVQRSAPFASLASFGSLRSRRSRGSTVRADEGAAEEERRVAQLRTLSIILLIAQNTVITLLARETRIPSEGRPMYLGSAAVLASELIKLPVCLGVITRDIGGLANMAREVWKRVFVGWRDTLAMGVPAFLFCFQNLLFFVSVSNLSATSYQLWSQSKTLTTALFFVLYLGGKLRSLQWVSLALLCFGVGLVSGGLDTSHPLCCVSAAVVGGWASKQAARLLWALAASR